MTENAKITVEAADRVLPKIEQINGVPFALLPPGSSVKDLPSYLDVPKFTKAGVSLQDRDSFVRYVDTYDTDGFAAIFFDRGQLCFKAILDYHSPKEAKHGYHTATYKMQQSLELQHWRGVLDKPLGQDAWIEFLEDRDVDFTKPSPAEIITIIKDFQIKKISEFKSTQILESGDVDLRYSTDSQPTGQTTIPRDIYLSFPLFEGDEPVDLKGRFRYSVREGRLSIRIVIPRLHDLLRERADEVASTIKNGLGAPLYLGTP